MFCKNGSYGCLWFFGRVFPGRCRRWRGGKRRFLRQPVLALGNLQGILPDVQRILFRRCVQQYRDPARLVGAQALAPHPVIAVGQSADDQGKLLLAFIVRQGGFDAFVKLPGMAGEVLVFDPDANPAVRLHVFIQHMKDDSVEPAAVVRYERFFQFTVVVDGAGRRIRLGMDMGAEGRKRNAKKDKK